jgi:hypothetical protein
VHRSRKLIPDFRLHRPQSEKITKSGPTGLIVTTTATGLDAELETRMLSLGVTDTPEQTRAVFRSLARNDNSSDAVALDYERWHRLQRWLAAGQRNVIIPFAEQLADRVLALAVRQRSRRDVVERERIVMVEPRRTGMSMSSSGSHATPRWRKGDSNPRSLSRSRRCWGTPS